MVGANFVIACWDWRMAPDSTANGAKTYTNAVANQITKNYDLSHNEGGKTLLVGHGEGAVVNKYILDINSRLWLSIRIAGHISLGGSHGGTMRSLARLVPGSPEYHTSYSTWPYLYMALPNDKVDPLQIVAKDLSTARNYTASRPELLALFEAVGNDQGGFMVNQYAYQRMNVGMFRNRAPYTNAAMIQAGSQFLMNEGALLFSNLKQKQYLGQETISGDMYNPASQSSAWMKQWSDGRRNDSSVCYVKWLNPLPYHFDGVLTIPDAFDAWMKVAMQWEQRGCLL